MKIELNKIARLNNNEKFIILNELDYNGSKYYLTMGIIGENEIDSNKVIILEELQDEEGYFVEKVIDSELLLTLTRLFRDQM